MRKAQLLEPSGLPIATQREWASNTIDDRQFSPIQRPSCGVCQDLQYKESPPSTNPGHFPETIPVFSFNVTVDELIASAHLGCALCQTLLTGFERFLQSEVSEIQDAHGSEGRLHNSSEQGSKEKGSKTWQVVPRGVPTDTAAHSRTAWRKRQRREKQRALETNMLTIEIRPVGPISLSRSQRGPHIEFFTEQGVSKSYQRVHCLLH